MRGEKEHWMQNILRFSLFIASASTSDRSNKIDRPYKLLPPRDFLAPSRNYIYVEPFSRHCSTSCREKDALSKRSLLKNRLLFILTKTASAVTKPTGKIMNQAVVFLNRAGIDFLDKGDLENALFSFRDALSSAVAHLQSLQAKESPAMSPKEDATMAQSPVHALSRIEPGEDDAVTIGQAVDRPKQSHTPVLEENHQFLLAQSVSTMTAATGTFDATPFMHARGLPIVGTEGFYSADAMVNASCTSAILIFNLAVAHHLKAMQGGSGSSSRCVVNWLTKAKSLYKSSLTLMPVVQWGDAVLEGASAKPVMDLLVMALFNNMAHVCFELSNYAESSMLFRELVGFALTVIPSTYGVGDDHLVLCMEDSKNNFLLNAITLRAPVTAPAA
jgi:hypothetical protein